MKWTRIRESGNVDDPRGLSGGKVAAGGVVAGIVIYLLYTLFSGNNIDPSQIQQQLSEQQNQTSQLTPEQQAADEERAKFVKVVLATTEDVWNKIFAESGNQYAEPTLVLFRGSVASACGNTSSASGPFYCPGDNKMYIDLSFYHDLQDKLNAPGDFPMAYVVGHHNQNLMGTADTVNQLRQQLSETEFNRYSVMIELQADFYSGVLPHHAQKIKKKLDPDDIDETLTATNAIGDDRLQKQSTGTVTPDAFTHGTTAQRMYWFKKGYEPGDIKQGDAFNDPSLKN